MIVKYKNNERVLFSNENQQLNTVFNVFDRYIKGQEIGALQKNSAYLSCDLDETSIPTLHIDQTIKLYPTFPGNLLSQMHSWHPIINKFTDGGKHKAVCIYGGQVMTDDNIIGVYIYDLNVLITSIFKKSVVGGIMPVTIRIRDAIKDILKPVPYDPVDYRKFKITIGCDPEFELEENGYTVPAQSCDSLYNNSEESIGLDSSGEQVELRPKHSSTPYKVADNVKKLLQEFRNSYNYTLNARGNVYPLGGHIHFGAKYDTLPKSTTFIKVLDNWIGKEVIELSGEARSHYKALSSTRPQAWGFEYRTIPSAVFVKRDVLLSVLRICYRLAHNFYNGKGIKLQPNGVSDYKAIGLEKDYLTIQKFKGEWEDTQGDVFRHWGIEKKQKHLFPTIYKRDNWIDDIWDVFISATSQEISFLPKKTRYNILSITCFGLKEDRGEVFYGFKGTNMKNVEDFEPMFREADGHFFFGFPRNIRMNTTDSHKTEFAVMIATLARTMVKEIQRRVQCA